MVRLYFANNQQKSWLQLQERLPTTPIFTPHMPRTPEMDHFLDLNKHTPFHILFERDFSAESHFPYQKMPNKPIKQRMHLKSSELFIFMVKKQQNFVHIMQMRNFPRKKTWLILCKHTFVLRINERTQNACINLYWQYIPMGIIIEKFL